MSLAPKSGTMPRASRVRALPTLREPMRKTLHLLAILFALGAFLPFATPSEAAPPTGKDWEALREAFELYFDPDEDLFPGRKAVRTLLGKQKEGYDILGDMPSLKQLIYESRSFHKQMSDKGWQKTLDERPKHTRKSHIHGLKSSGLSLGWTLPKDYPRKNRDLDRKRPAPWPLIVSTHTKSDFNKDTDFPVLASSPRLFPKGEWQEVLNQWITMTPTAPAGAYHRDDQLAMDRIIRPLARFAQHYHIDFDRIVLDGGQEALDMAHTAPMFWSGIVVRDGKMDAELAKALVPNFASLPIFIHSNAKLAKNLEDGGHKLVTSGGDAELKTWLDERRAGKRPLPTSFTWNSHSSKHVFAWWVNIDLRVTAATKNELKVEVVDTEEDPNTIKIDAVGITSISLFLNDEIVDLDRPVRLLINGWEEKNEKLDRNLDIAFNTDPLKVRDTMFFALVFPARLPAERVRPPKAVEKPTEPVASDEDQEKAAKYLAAAKKMIESGKSKDNILKRLNAVIELGNTPSRAEAQKLLKELE